MPNTLGVLLGNLKRFVKDVSFAPDTKCLIWEDEEGRPVAAIWNQDQFVDKGLKQGPMAFADFKGMAVEYFDMMGAKRVANKKNFSRVAVSVLHSRRKRGKSMSSPMRLSTPRRLAEHRLSRSAYPRSWRLQAKSNDAYNTVSRDISGTLDANGEKKSVSMKPLGQDEIIVKMKNALAFDKIEKIEIPYSFTSGDKKTEAFFNFNGFAIKAVQRQLG
jgi:hypothetical protein